MCLKIFAKIRYAIISATVSNHMQLATVSNNKHQKCNFEKKLKIIFICIISCNWLQDRKINNLRGQILQPKKQLK